MAVRRESELYEPVKTFFARRGYDVRAEVRGCDLIAFHPERSRPVVAELKKSFTLALLLQGLDRQRTGADVWLAVERPRAGGGRSRRLTELASLCRRLGLGLLTVVFRRGKEPLLEVWCEPAEAADGLPFLREGRRKAGVRALRREFEARSGDYNVGGSAGRKLVTAYRERAIRCALALYCHGAASPRQIAEWTGCPNVGPLLRDNHYGWFRRPSRGRYELTEQGVRALAEFAAAARAWAARYPWTAGVALPGAAGDGDASGDAGVTDDGHDGGAGEEAGA